MNKVGSVFNRVSTIAALLALVAIVIVGYLLAQEVRIALLRLTPTPVSVTQAQAICSRLSLPSDDSRCQSHSVYVSEFFTVIRERYIPAKWSSANRGTVDRELGAYLLRCEDSWSITSEGDLQDCYYDLNGDRAYLLTITYQHGYKTLALPSDRIRSIRDDFGWRTISNLDPLNSDDEYGSIAPQK